MISHRVLQLYGQFEYKIRDRVSKYARSRIAVIIPAYFAAASIKKVISGIPDYVSDIIVVDDCSKDETAEIVTSLIPGDGRINLTQHNINQGVGGAMLTGYTLALELGADLCVKMDSDDQMDPAFLPELLTPIIKGKADYTKGNRFIFLREIQHMPLARRLGNFGLSFLSKIASGYWNIFDPSNGYTAIHRDALTFILNGHVDRRFFFETSVLIELGISRAVVQDVYIPAKYDDEKSHLSELDSLLRFPIKLISGAIRRIGIQYVIRDFSAITLFLLIGLPILLFGTVFGAYHWVLSIMSNKVASTGTVMVSVLPFILGVQFLLQAFVLDIQNTPVEPISSMQL